MKTKCVFAMVSLLSVTATAGPAEPATNSLANLLNEVERAVTNELQLFDADNKVEHLKRALEIAESLDRTAHQKKYSPEAALAKIRLMLVVADKCFKARDKSYDVRKMPDCVVRVFPPPSAGPNAYPGMPPEEIKDPEARKQYEAAIAENERKRAKHKRELELQRMIDRAVRFAQLFLEGRPPERRDALLGVLTNAVQEVEIRRLILSDSTR